MTLLMRLSDLLTSLVLILYGQKAEFIEKHNILKIIETKKFYVEVCKMDLELDI